MRTVRQGKHFKANRRFPNSNKGSSKQKFFKMKQKNFLETKARQTIF